MHREKGTGGDIDTKNIKKHKNDIFRLLINVSPTSRIETPRNIQNDVNLFLDQIKEDKPDLKNLGIRGASLNELLDILRAIFLGN